MNCKRSWRNELKVRLSQISYEDKRVAEAKIAQRLLDVIDKMSNGRSSKAKTWGFYWPHQFEPNLLQIASKVSLAFPKVEGLTLSWWQPQVVEDAKNFEKMFEANFAPGAFGVMEPVSAVKQICADELCGWIIPGIGFDRMGYRLGRGQGFYDRALAQVKGQIRIGVCFQVQLVHELPREDHDVRMDLIVTEKETLKLGEEGFR